MIRMATYDDLPELLRMGEEFFNHSGYTDSGEFNVKLVIDVLSSLIENGTLLITDGGMIGWMVTPMYMTGEPMASELFWWVDEDKRTSGVGRDLLKTMERLVEADGINIINMVSLEAMDGQRVGALYASLGYKLKEYTYSRRIK